VTRGRDVPESEEKSTHGEAAAPAALPRSVHFGVPIASILVLLAFAFVIASPANKAALPIQSTLFFIPIYITIVIVLVFASMYLFKAIIEKDVPSAGDEHPPTHQEGPV
jgi:hypothetical protein